MKIVLSILKRFVPHLTVLVIGSRIHENAKETSDIDLVLMNEKPLTIDVLSSLHNAFSDSTLPMKVDIVEWATTAESFRKIIQEKNVKIQ